MDHAEIINAALSQPENPTLTDQSLQCQLNALAEFIDVEFPHWYNMQYLCKRIKEAERRFVRLAAVEVSAPAGAVGVDTASEQEMLEILKADISQFQEDQSKRTKTLDGQELEIKKMIDIAEVAKEAELARFNAGYPTAAAGTRLDSRISNAAAPHDEGIEVLEGKLEEVRKKLTLVAVAQATLEGSMMNYAINVGLEDTELNEWVYSTIHGQYLCLYRGNITQAAEKVIRYILHEFAQNYFRFEDPSTWKVAASIIYGPGAPKIDFSQYTPEQVEIRAAYEEALAKCSEFVDSENLSHSDSSFMDSSDEGYDENDDDFDEGEDQHFDDEGDEQEFEDEKDEEAVTSLAKTDLSTPLMENRNGPLIDLSDPAIRIAASVSSTSNVLADMDPLIDVSDTSTITHTMLELAGLSLGGYEVLSSQPRSSEASDLGDKSFAENHLSDSLTWEYGASRYAYCHRCRENGHADKYCHVPDVPSDLPYKFPTYTPSKANGSCENCGKNTHASSLCPDAYPGEEQDE